MNTFGEFLYELRKENGMTQAELAERLGVTNKAVSKWETGEAMPETSLLLPLAEIFGVTVDELLNGKRSGSSEQNSSQQSTDDAIKGHLFTRGKDDGPETTLDKICGVICAAVVLCGITVYLFLGVFADLWNPYWIIIPTCALGSGIIGIIFNLCDSEKRKKKTAKGENPFCGAICGLIMLTSIITYLFLGTFLGLWHPLWIIIVVGAFACVIIGSVYEIFTHKK